MVSGVRIALATCPEFPGVDPDDAPVLAPLAERGITATPAVWDDPTVDWASYDLTVVRSTWDYPKRRAEFLAWARSVPRLANPAGVLEWNTDKRYLGRLAEAGAPVVPTAYLAPGERGHAPNAGEWVVKPTVSAGSRDTGRYDLGDPDQRALAFELVSRLHAAGRDVMVQPYLEAVAEYGETALLYFGGRFSHAIRKGPMLDGPYEDVPSLYKREDIRPRRASAEEREVADKVFAAVPGADRLLYARMDLIPGSDGPTLVELELTEPSVFLRHDPAAGVRFADAIVAALEALPRSLRPGRSGGAAAGGGEEVQRRQPDRAGTGHVRGDQPDRQRGEVLHEADHPLGQLGADQDRRGGDRPAARPDRPQRQPRRQ